MITAQIEPWSDCLEELKPFFPRHWEELGLFRDRMPLDPMYHEYFSLEAAGALMVATVRNDGAVIGYGIFFVKPSLHYGQTLTATMDICYVDPDWRRSKAGTMLFDEIERELRRRGVKLWWVGSKNHKPIEGFFRQAGFSHEESYFCKWLGGAE